MNKWLYNDILFINECWIQISIDNTEIPNINPLLIENNSENFVIEKTSQYNEKYNKEYNQLENNSYNTSLDIIFIKKIILKSYNNKHYNYNEYAIYSNVDNFVKLFGKNFTVINKDYKNYHSTEGLWQII